MRYNKPYEEPYLPTDAQERKVIPVMTGVLDYFPLALCEVARLSKKGNDQHNPGQELHWARAKSTDEADAAIRHLMERGALDTDGIRHTAKAAWRVLALLQKEMEEALGKPASRASYVEYVDKPEPPPRAEPEAIIPNLGTSVPNVGSDWQMHETMPPPQVQSDRWTPTGQTTVTNTPRFVVKPNPDPTKDRGWEVYDTRARKVVAKEWSHWAAEREANFRNNNHK